MGILYLDCFSGASGDMLLGALIDAGVPLDGVRQALGSLAIEPATVWTERVLRTGVAATKFCVRGEDPPPGGGRVPAASMGGHMHPHAPDAGHHHGTTGQDPLPAGASGHDWQVAHAGTMHRTLPDIYRLIDGSSLSGAGKDRAKALFARLGDAEATVHGTTPDKVHLHEVGALDSIIDVVGAVYAMEFLGAGTIMASPLNVGGGMVRTAHGLFPVPAPATMYLLGHAPIYAGPQQVEMVTPTGALLVTAFVERFGPLPPMQVRTIGYGAGSRDLPDTPNVLRVLLGDATGVAPADVVTVIECEIDDMNPQIFGRVMEQLLAAGALDVFYTAVQMKKNRPGTLLTVLAEPSRRTGLVEMILRETTTIGVRYREAARECLAREERTLDTPLGPVRFKVASRDGQPLNVSAEFDDVVRLAERHGRPVKDVHALALKAYWDQVSPQS